MQHTDLVWLPPWIRADLKKKNKKTETLKEKSR